MSMFRRKRSAEDFAEEIKAHLALEADELRREGLGKEDAQWKALREFGSLRAAQERFYMLRIALIATESGLCCDGDLDAGLGRWREHSRLQRDERSAAAVASGGRSESPCVFEDVEPSTRNRHHRQQ
jgi:hypothetical protein